MARTTNQRQRFVTSVPDSTWTTLTTAGQEAFLNGGNSLLLRFSWDDFPGVQHPHGMYVLMEELLYANGVLGAGGSTGQTCWVYPDATSVCVRYSNLNGQGVAISVWQRSVAALAYNVGLTWNIECTQATGPEEVRAGTVLRPTANRGWHTVYDGAGVGLAAAYATIGTPFNVSNCDRINLWVAYARGGASVAGRGLLRVEKSIVPNTNEPTTITQWCPEIIQDGASFVATATGGQVDTYQEEACLSPTGGLQNFFFTIDTAGYNWCRVRMADTDAANPGTCFDVRFIEVGK